MTPPPALHPYSGQVRPHLDEGAMLDLLLGRLPQADRNSALTHLLTCPECERLFQQTGRKFERLRASSVYRTLLQDGPIPDGVEDRGSSPTPAAERLGRNSESSAPGRVWRGLLAALRRPRYVAGMSMSLAAMVIVALLVVRNSERVVLPSETDWLPAGSELTDLRSEGSPSTGGSLQSAEAEDAGRASADLLRAVQAYARRDLGAAIQGLRSARTTGPLESIRLIYLGNALAHQGNYTEAAGILQTALHKNLPNAWREEGRWTLLVAFNRTGQRASADSLLRLLAAQPGEVGGRVRALLSKHGSKDFR